MAKTEYVISIYTDDRPASGTDANVSITIYGSRGSFSLKVLGKGDKLESGKTDEVRISVPNDLGTIERIKVSHDNTGKGAEWFLEGINVRKVDNAESWYFPANRWFKQYEKNQTVSATLYPGNRRPHFTYINNHPEDREPGWSEELNGVCHDDKFWYFTRNRKKSAVSSTYSKQFIYKIPVEFNLTNQFKGTLYTRSIEGHFGDLDYWYGKLFVAVSHDKSTGSERNVIEIYDADSLRFVTRQIMRDKNGIPFKDIGWCAVNPQDGMLYTSNGPVTRERGIYVYRINTEAFTDTSKELLTYRCEILLQDENGYPLERGSMQGGCFDEHNFLYITNGYQVATNGKNNTYVKDANGGISVYKVKVRPTEDYKVKRIMNSTQNGKFAFQFDGAREEPEGITYWDLDDGRAPGIRGSLHAIMLDNLGVGDDDLFFKHYYRELEIEQQSGTGVATKGSRQHFTVWTLGGTPPLSYRWWRRETNGTVTNIHDGVRYGGTDTRILEVKHCYKEDDGVQFYCRISDRNGDVVTSKHMNLVIRE